MVFIGIAVVRKNTFSLRPRVSPALLGPGKPNKFKTSFVTYSRLVTVVVNLPAWLAEFSFSREKKKKSCTNCSVYCSQRIHFVSCHRFCGHIYLLCVVCNENQSGSCMCNYWQHAGFFEHVFISQR